MPNVCKSPPVSESWRHSLNMFCFAIVLSTLLNIMLERYLTLFASHWSQSPQHVHHTIIIDNIKNGKAYIINSNIAIFKEIWHLHTHQTVVETFQRRGLSIINHSHLPAQVPVSKPQIMNTLHDGNYIKFLNVAAEYVKRGSWLTSAVQK